MTRSHFEKDPIGVPRQIESVVHSCVKPIDRRDLCLDQVDTKTRTGTDSRLINYNVCSRQAICRSTQQRKKMIIQPPKSMRFSTSSCTDRKGFERNTNVSFINLKHRPICKNLNLKKHEKMWTVWKNTTITRRKVFHSFLTERAHNM